MDKEKWTLLVVVTTNYSFRGRKKIRLRSKIIPWSRVLFVELTDPRVVKNYTVVCAVTPLTAHLLFPFPMNLYASKSV
jgi:hypothetical protein